MSSTENVILVTGATGAVGRETLKSLAKLKPANTIVKAQIRKDEQKDEIKKVYPDAEFAKIDYDDIESVFKALTGVTTLFIVTPYTVAQNVMARLLIDGAVKAKTKHIVHLGVSQPEKSAGDYIAWHLFTEKYIESTGIAWTHLRPNMFVDNLTKYGNIETFKAGTLTFPLKPTLALPWVTTSDIGAVSAGVLANPSLYSSQIVPITSELNSINGIVKAIEGVSGEKVQLVTPSPADFYTALVSSGGEPAYCKGFRVNVEEHNVLEDATKAWGAKEGLESVRKIAGKEPQSIKEWAQENKETWTKKAAPKDDSKDGK